MYEGCIYQFLRWFAFLKLVALSCEAAPRITQCVVVIIIIINQTG